MSDVWNSDLSFDVEGAIEGAFDVMPDPARDGIVLWSRNGRLQAYSGPVLGILGLPDGALSLGMKASDIHALQESCRDARFLNGFASELASGDLELAAPREDFRVVLDSGRVVRIDRRQRRDGGVATVVSEVPDFVPAGTAAREESDALRGIFEDCPIGVLVLCNDTNECLMANASLTRWFGSDFVEGIAGAKPCPVGDRTDDLASILIDPNFSMAMAEYEIEREALDGGTRWILLSGRPITFEGCDARIIWFRDISVRRRQAKDLQSKVAEKTRQLEEALHRADLASLAKTQFLANMSHELRTPLNSIIGFSDLLQKEMFGPIGSERYVEFVQHIHSAGAHLLELINDILDVSRIELGEMGLKEDLFDIARSVSATIAMIRPKLAEKGHHFSASLPDGPVGFVGDERQIRQILMNLLTNAVKFTDANGVIALSLTVDAAAGVVLEVSDNGIGIREGDLDRVLNPFEQATDETYSRSIEGAGLGLYLTQAIAKAHGGDLKIRSALSEGTTITVTLPAERLQPLA
ncbi:HAMP domain-containing histidine kinase [Nisaea acidiphila]|uniref:histidine kinase n=1 Tax=Nisaea acidiphila TaxID=1862145 RepID=A0A9J7AVL5_9PROT|nr:HAMP domain-containing sensor histidine kinase [Nisaea acidiphila]UUX50332.1 HAMP domain-containing histidine kinase [Nisaea acidiphila]